MAAQIGGEVLEVFVFSRSLGMHQPVSRLLISTIFMRWHVDLLLYSVTVAAAHAVWLRREAATLALQASQMETRLAEARLDALKSQVHPHFLFNTLHAISALILKSESQLAMEMVSRLSDFLRVVLDHANVQRVALKEELDLLHLYLDIQRVRFGRRLKFSVDVPAELMSLEVPYLLLQPLVENAIKHGLERYASAGRIEVRAWEQGDSVHLLVRNDGGEFRDSAPGVLRERIGLKNTRQRLQLLYGERQQVELRPAPEGGVIVEIVIPISEASFSQVEVPTEEVPVR
jgi:LytS/YehU family sensor histidine kinase